jgi:hypothetical protein
MSNVNNKGNQLAFASQFQEGMELRDYFAAQAMLGLVGGNWNIASFEKYAEKAYAIAEEMMKERGRR